MTMNSLRIISLLMVVLALTSANDSPKKGPVSKQDSENSITKSSTKPTDWMPVAELESLPSTNEVTLQSLESMSVQDGSDMLNKMFHLSQAGQAIESNYVPKPSEIPAYLVTPDNKKIKFKLSELPKIAQEEKEFGDQEVTIFIKGLPEHTESIKKAYRKLEEAYMLRYNGELPKSTNIKYEEETKENNNPSSSEEQEDDEMKSGAKKPSGNLVVIELGSMFQKMKDYIAMDIEKTGMEIGDILVQFVDKANVPFEIVHIIATNMASHVAGVAGRQFTRETGHLLRRITGLDPTNIYTRSKNSLIGLARGDAEFVDVIHTSAYGMGTPTRSGDVDFYPNGPNEGVPGADSVVEASMRSIRYFAESVIPGNERNFPAVGATSLRQYKERSGNGKRVYMGYNTDYDIEGDFVLEVNSKSPFGKRTPAQRQQNFHSVHKPWKTSSRDL